MIKVFLSYAHEDFVHAEKLYEVLTAIPSVELWFDKESLLPGQKWEIEIRKAIGDSRFFLLLLSSHSTSKIGFYQKEIRRALEVFEGYPDGEIFLIPVRLDDCKLHMEQLTSIHYVDLFPDWDMGIAKILRVLNSHQRLSTRESHLEGIQPAAKTVGSNRIVTKKSSSHRVKQTVKHSERKKIVSKQATSSKKVTLPANARDPKTFLSFIGLRCGYTVKDARDLYGWASKRKTSGSRNIRYFLGGLIIWYHSYPKTIFRIEVNSQKAVTEIRKKLNERKLYYFGKHKQTIIENLGKPNVRAKDGYTYIFSDSQGHSGEVTFHFGEPKTNCCTAIEVLWIG